MNAVLNNYRKQEQKSWRARLELGYANKNGRTILNHRLHKGPLVVQKPFYPEGGVCHSYLIHPPGGIVGGDILELDINAGNTTNVLVTTPAANKFYRSVGPQAQLQQSLRVQKDAVFEWLPQETIFYNQCNASVETIFELEDNAQLTCWEINCFGRPAGQEFFDTGSVLQKMTVKRDGIPLYIDRTCVDGKSGILTAKWGLNSFSVMATMLVTVNNNLPDLESMLELQQHNENYMLSITLQSDVIVIRYFGFHAREALSVFTQCWQISRQSLSGKKICPPRIWAT